MASSQSAPGDAGLVEVARIEAERAGRVVVPGQIGAEHGRVVGRDRAAERRRRRGAAADARRATRPPSCAGSRSGRRRGRSGRSASSRDERGILDGADPVPDPLGAERVERAADRRRAGDLAGVRHRGETLGAGDARTPSRTARAGTAPRGRRGRRRRRRDPGTSRHGGRPPRASSSVKPRTMSGVRRISTPKRSRASCAPSQYPLKISSQSTPRRTRSLGEKIPST